MSSYVSPSYPSAKSAPTVMGTQACPTSTPLAQPISAPIQQPISAPYYDKGCHYHKPHKPCKSYYTETGIILVLFILLVIIGRAWSV